MNQEKIGKFIKEKRIDNKLSQKELADALGVTPQAVSKWENGKNLPDMTVLTEMSKLFNVSIEEIICGKKTKKRISKWWYGLIGVMVICVIIIIILLVNNNDYLEYKNLITSSSDFVLNGTLVKTNEHTLLVIDNVKYSSDDETIYEELNCTLYQIDGNTQILMSSADEGYDTTLSSYLESVRIIMDHESDNCTMFINTQMVIRLDLLAYDGKTISYEIPIIIDEEECS